MQLKKNEGMDRQGGLSRHSHTKRAGGSIPPQSRDALLDQQECLVLRMQSSKQIKHTPLSHPFQIKLFKNESTQKNHRNKIGVNSRGQLHVRINLTPGKGDFRLSDGLSFCWPSFLNSLRFITQILWPGTIFLAFKKASLC